MLTSVIVPNVSTFPPNGRRAMLGASAIDFFAGNWWEECNGKFAVLVVRVLKSDGSHEKFFSCYDNEQAAQSTARSHYESWKADSNTASLRAEVHAGTGELLYAGGAGKGKRLLIGIAIASAALLATGGMVWFITRKSKRGGLSGARRRRR